MLRKIKDTDLQGKGNVGQPDVPNLNTLEMQQKLDELSLDVIVPIHNELVDELEAPTAAGELGAVVDDDYSFQMSSVELEKDTETKIQTLINTILKECETLDLNLYDLATIFNGISSVASSVTDDPTAVPTSRAIINYVSMLGGGDMLKSRYDSNNDGTVNDSDKLGGELPSYYQKATDTDLDTTDKTTTGAINEVLGAVGDVANDLGDFAELHNESLGGSTIETIGHSSIGTYGIGDLFVADDGFVYKAIAIISPGNTLSIANCTKTNIKAELNTTNTALINKVSKFIGGGYVPVDSIAYDSTNEVLGLKVNGADTVIPFKKSEMKHLTDLTFTNLNNTSVSQTVDISEYYSGDLSTLTDDNFVVLINQINTGASGAGDYGRKDYVHTVTKSYSNGVLTVTGVSRNTFNYGSSGSTTSSIAVSVYMV